LPNFENFQHRQKKFFFVIFLALFFQVKPFNPQGPLLKSIFFLRGDKDKLSFLRKIKKNYFLFYSKKKKKENKNKKYIKP